MAVNSMKMAAAMSVCFEQPLQRGPCARPCLLLIDILQRFDEELWELSSGQHITGYADNYLLSHGQPSWLLAGGLVLQRLNPTVGPWQSDQIGCGHTEHSMLRIKRTLSQNRSCR
jgi:hypothetical protein